VGYRKLTLLFWLGPLSLLAFTLLTNAYAQHIPLPSQGGSSKAGTASPPKQSTPVGPASGTPTVTRIDPEGFLKEGGSTVTITGTNFGGVTQVSFGDVASPKVTVQDANTIKAVVPPLPPNTNLPFSPTVKVTTNGTKAADGTITGIQPANNACMTAKNETQTCTISYVKPHPCGLFPTVGMCQGDATVREANINSYYDTTGTLTFFGQIKSIYNGASSSATVSADLATLNFSNGMQMTAGTNIQAGSSTSTTNVASGTTPTLSASGAAQAAQNMIYGGNFTARAVMPVTGFGIQTSSPGGIGGTLDGVLQGGVDVQNFKAGTSTSATSPSSHGLAGMEGYLFYNSINPASGSNSTSNIYAGAIFVGGSYGYSYTSHDYARDYGFGHVNRGVGQASAGILINNVAKITISRGFGPSQVYNDSTSGATTTVNNFKAWSFGITYQSTAKSTSTTAQSTGSTAQSSGD
jgi:IPT/TIG domain